MLFSPQSGTDEPETDREEILRILNDAIHDVRDRATDHEGDTIEGEEMQINWYRTLATLAGQYRMLQRDTDIGEMEEELELLQKATGLDDQGDTDEQASSRKRDR